MIFGECSPIESMSLPRKKLLSQLIEGFYIFLSTTGSIPSAGTLWLAIAFRYTPLLVFLHKCSQYNSLFSVEISPNLASLASLRRHFSTLSGRALGVYAILNTDSPDWWIYLLALSPRYIHFFISDQNTFLSWSYLSSFDPVSA